MRFLLALGLAAAAPASAAAGTIKLFAYDGDGKLMDRDRLMAFLARADRAAGEERLPITVSAPDGSTESRPELVQSGPILTLSWKRLPRVQLALVWPVRGDGFSTVWADKEGRGYGDGEAVYLNEEVALTQYRQFREAWTRHTKDMEPRYQPGRKVEKRADRARALMAEAQALQDGSKRAKAFDKALSETALAWQEMLYEHGLQIAAHPKVRSSLRFGLTLDESLLQRIEHYEWIVEMVERSRANWVRLVFRPNPADFLYARPASFNEYDAVVKALRAKNIRIMGCVLDTAQWPSTLTPELYAARVKNLVLRYRGQINSWEVGPEINGDWLGGQKAPLGLERQFQIFVAGAAQVKEIEPTLETVATLYWWGPTAPSEEHSLFGWLSRYASKGFLDRVDVVAVSLWPDDNPVGLAFERIFERLHQFAPDKRLMLGSVGYVEGDRNKGYWWLHPTDVDGARKDLAILYTSASCAMRRSLCGGFWWHTLQQMIPAKRKNTDLYRVYKRTLEQLGR